MPEAHVEKAEKTEKAQIARIAVRKPSSSIQNAVLWLLFFAMFISISRNVYQEQKVDRVAQDLSSLRQDSQKQIAELRDAQSASLEQDLLRIDQLSSEVAKSNDNAMREATALASKTKSDLARTVEQRHQEMITAISDLRADLRTDIRARASSAGHAAQTASTDAGSSRAEAAAANSTAAVKAANPPVAASLAAVPDEPGTEPSAKKKHFWDKLNPFGKKKQETAVNGAQYAQ